MAEEKVLTLRDIFLARNVEGVLDALEEMYAAYLKIKRPPEPEPTPLPGPTLGEGVNLG